MRALVLLMLTEVASSTLAW